MAVKIDKESCIGCGCCSDVCAQGALELDDKAVVNEEFCTECLNCIDLCPALAISAEPAQS